MTKFYGHSELLCDWKMNCCVSDSFVMEVPINEMADPSGWIGQVGHAKLEVAEAFFPTIFKIYCPNFFFFKKN